MDAQERETLIWQLRMNTNYSPTYLESLKSEELKKLHSEKVKG